MPSPQDPKSSWLFSLTRLKGKEGSGTNGNPHQTTPMDTLSGDAYPELKLRRDKTVPELPAQEDDSREERLNEQVVSGKIRTFSPSEISHFFHELLTAGFLDLFIRTVEQVRTALESALPEDRRWALESVKALVAQEDLSLVPYGTLPLLLDCVGRLLVREERVELRDAAIDLTAQLLGIEAAHGELESVHAHLAWLERTARARGGEYTSRVLASRSLVLRPLETYFREGQKVLKDRVMPFFQFVGEPGMRTLTLILDEEQSRQHRNRILELLKLMGPLSFPALKEGLVSGSWHLVRNALNLVGELEEPQAFEYIVPCLDHPDERVVRSAVRALWKTGGSRAERYLLELLPKAGTEIQAEILHGLTRIGTAESVPAIGVLAAKGPDGLRLQALETLGRLKLAEALPILSAQIQRKGRIFKTAEPMPIRMAAAKALLTIGTQEARRLLDQAVEDEPKGPDQEAFRSIASGISTWQ